ncbi:MAG TPA: hypothetical protein VJ724_01035 [Tahibacter sp.]|nr:hypothetical protein [Tahibacter sp.]
MKKIQLSKETLRELTSREAGDVAGGAPRADDAEKAIVIGVKIETRPPCQTFPVNVCVTGRC